MFTLTVKSKFFTSIRYNATWKYIIAFMRDMKRDGFKFTTGFSFRGVTLYITD